MDTNKTVVTGVVVEEEENKEEQGGSEKEKPPVQNAQSLNSSEQLSFNFY